MPAFHHTVALRWGDFDALKHVNNVSFFEFMQDARVALIAATGLSRKDLSVIGHFVAHNEIDYIAPIGMEHPSITVRIWVIAVKGASYELGYEFVDGTGKVYAKARTVMVTVLMENETVIRVPDDLRSAMTEFMLEEA